MKNNKAATDFYAQSAPHVGQKGFPHSLTAQVIRAGSPLAFHK